MKTKFFALAFLLTALPVFAQAPLSGHVASDTAGSVAVIIKYIGTGSAATVEVDAATGDIELEIADVVDNTNVDTASVCAGGVAGSLDVSDAQCDTFGELMTMFNASTHWRMVLVSVLASDTTINTLAVKTETQATVEKGLPLYIDSAVSLTASIAMVPSGCEVNIGCFGVAPGGKVQQNPFGGKQAEVRWIEGYSTFATTGTFNVYSVKPSQTATTYSEVVTLLYTEVTGATGTNKQLSQFQYFGLLGRPHEKVIVRITDTGASSAFFLHAYGFERSVN